MNANQLIFFKTLVAAFALVAAGVVALALSGRGRKDRGNKLVAQILADWISREQLVAVADQTSEQFWTQKMQNSAEAQKFNRLDVLGGKSWSRDSVAYALGYIQTHYLITNDTVPTALSHETQFTGFILAATINNPSKASFVLRSPLYDKLPGILRTMVTAGRQAPSENVTQGLAEKSSKLRDFLNTCAASGQIISVRLQEQDLVLSINYLSVNQPKIKDLESLTAGLKLALLMAL